MVIALKELGQQVNASGGVGVDSTIIMGGGTSTQTGGHPWNPVKVAALQDLVSATFHVVRLYRLVCAATANQPQSHTDPRFGVTCACACSALLWTPTGHMAHTLCSAAEAGVSLTRVRAVFVEAEQRTRVCRMS